MLDEDLLGQIKIIWILTWSGVLTFECFSKRLHPYWVLVIFDDHLLVYSHVSTPLDPLSKERLSESKIMLTSHVFFDGHFLRLHFIFVIVSKFVKDEHA